MRTPIALMLAMVLAGAIPARAEVYTVNDTADAPDANAGDGLCLTSGGMCSVRAAVQQANAHAGADEIVLPDGSYDLTVVGAGEEAAATGDLDVTDDLTVSGPIALTENASIDANGIDRIFDVKSGASLTVARVHLRDGVSVADPRGGDVLNAGTLTIESLTLSGGKADDGAGSGAGGGLYNLGIATVRGCFVAGNVVSTAAAATGGGIHNAGTLTVVNSTIGENNWLFVASQAAGAGLYNGPTGMTSLQNATIAFNGDPNNVTQRGPGAGVFNDGGTVTLRNTAIGANYFLTGAGDCGGTLVSEGYNVVSDVTGCTLIGDLTGVTTGVGIGLSNGPSFEGGPTPVFPIYAPGSPLVDTGNPAPAGTGGFSCDARDQRNYNRGLHATRCDIGAEEIGRCMPLPIFEGCQYRSQQGKIHFRNFADDSKDSLKWSLASGGLLSDETLGTGADDYSLCIWDEAGLLGEALMPGGGDCNGKPCWIDKPTGLKYGDKQALPDGISKARFTAGRVGKGATAALIGKGAQLRIAPPPWSGAVIVRVRNEGADVPELACLQTTHHAPKKNTAAEYKALGD